MNTPGIIVKFHCKKGMRDKVKSIWENHVKPHVIQNEDVHLSLYNFGAENPDLIVLVELLKDASVLQSAFTEDWFQAYLMELEPLLEEPPKVTPILNVWSKDKE